MRKGAKAGDPQADEMLVAMGKTVGNSGNSEDSRPTSLEKESPNGKKTSSLTSCSSDPWFRKWITAPVNTPVPVGLSEEAWRKWLKEVATTRNTLTSKVCMLLVHGEDFFGQTYIQIAEDAGCSVHTLTNGVKIARHMIGVDPKKLEALRSFWNFEPLAVNGLSIEDKNLLLDSLDLDEKPAGQQAVRKAVKAYLAARSEDDEGKAQEASDIAATPTTRGERKKAAQAAGSAIADKLPPRPQQEAPASTDGESSPFDDVSESTVTVDSMPADAGGEVMGGADVAPAVEPLPIHAVPIEFALNRQSSYFGMWLAWKWGVDANAAMERAVRERYMAERGSGG
jgi:hypothetical protein